jgi:hypothetical protein
MADAAAWDPPHKETSFRAEASFNQNTMQEAKEAALRKKVFDAQHSAAIEKVRVRRVP